MKNKTAIATAAALVAVIASSLASAAGPQATATPQVSGKVTPTTITGCIEGPQASKESKGDLKLTNCSPGSKKVTWNRKGPKGDTGAAGLAGRNGVDGRNGADGKNGLNGAAGPQGPAGPAGAPAPTLNRLTGDFCGTDATVSTSLDGVTFGPYTDGGTGGGSFCYDGLNGRTLADISQLSYTVMHSAETVNGLPATNRDIGSPYLRVFLTDGESEHQVIFDATECATVVPTESVFHTYEVTDGTDAQVRYDDDACGPVANPGGWDDVVEAHGSDEITGVFVTTGFTGGNDLAAILRSLKVNGTDYVFGAA